MFFSFNLQICNKPGIVIRVALVLERRAYSIQSLTIEPIDAESGFAEMRLRVSGPSEKREQVIKQLSKIIDVIQVEEVAELNLKEVEEKFFIV